MEPITLPRCEHAETRERIVSRLSAFLKALPLNKPWRIRVDELKGDRTEHQNNALFGVAYPPLIKATGYRKDEIHEVMCQKFFGTKVVEFGGVISEKPVRTTTTDEQGHKDVIPWDKFTEFYAMVQQVGAEMDPPIWIPDPDRHLRVR